MFAHGMVYWACSYVDVEGLLCQLFVIKQAAG